MFCLSIIIHIRLVWRGMSQKYLLAKNMLLILSFSLFLLCLFFLPLYNTFPSFVFFVMQWNIFHNKHLQSERSHHVPFPAILSCYERGSPAAGWMYHSAQTNLLGSIHVLTHLQHMPFFLYCFFTVSKLESVYNLSKKEMVLVMTCLTDY